ncbi:MAG TPA: alkaline phosphatase family protein [Chthoniobacterales bacterium]|nr:alkaline phosphatase family protein [Chthoniobacterales bacterium]
MSIRLSLCALLALHLSARSGPGQTPVLPTPDRSGIEHVVVVTMDNRSFDHFLGWLAGANGQQAGLSYSDSAGASHPTYHLTDYQGCSFLDPGHTYSDGRVQFNGGAANGWLLDGSNSLSGTANQANDIFAIGYYTQTDLAFLGSAAPAWTACDNYFASIMAETRPNRIYLHAAQTDRLDNSSVLSGLPTIWDRLSEHGQTGRYYYSDVSFLDLWGTKYAGIVHPLVRFMEDCSAGTLPNVAFVDPQFLGEASGASNDDHPHADVRNGEVFLNQIYQAVVASPNWKHTVLIITCDEWGGFFDHVAPPLAPIPAATAAAGDTDGRLGFRVPCVVISPMAQRGFVAHEQFDHTSILRMIEWRWSLPALSNRDLGANNLADVLDFVATPNLTAPTFNVPGGPFGAACP